MITSPIAITAMITPAIAGIKYMSAIDAATGIGAGVAAGSLPTAR